MPRRHVDDEHGGTAGDRGPIEPPGHLAVAIVSGEECNCGIGLAMGDRYAGICEPANTGGDTGDYPKRDAGSGESQGLLATAPEDTGIPTLEAQNSVAVASQLNEPRRDVRLARRRTAATLARVVEGRTRPREAKNARIHQRIVDDNIGTRE